MISGKYLWFMFFYKEIYKFFFVNSFRVDPSAYIDMVKILFSPRDPFEKPCSRCIESVNY